MVKKKVLSLFYSLQRVKQLHFLYFQLMLQCSHKVNQSKTLV